MNKIHIHLIAAARPNFMKVAPLYHALCREAWCVPVLIHTGQHYDTNMSAEFLHDLELPEPNYHLGVGSGTHSEQTAVVMVEYERVCEKQCPDMVVVVGDVNSTLACALVAKKLNIRLAHLEAGLRSFDRTMPEEINRLVTDALSDILWTPSLDANENLRREGIAEDRVVRVGNIMMDSFEMLREKIESKGVWKTMGLKPLEYGLVTLHRPSNVDTREVLSHIVDTIRRLSERIPLLFPVHPRTKLNLKTFGLEARINNSRNVKLLEPLGYIDFMNLVTKASFVLTDSGGIQEETTYLGIPCMTLRNSTERPVTITDGTNKLVKPNDLERCLGEILSGNWSKGRKIEMWDGLAAKRVVEDLKTRLC